MVKGPTSKKQKVAVLLTAAFTLLSVLLTGAEALAKQALRRADLQVKGSSCATCLIRLEKKLKATPGVVKAVVSIYKPFNAAVIFDADKTSWAKIKETLDSEKVEASGLKEAAVESVPLVLEPR